MRRLRLLHVALAACAIALAAPGRADEPSTVAMPLQQVSPNAWFVQGQAALGSSANQNFISNAGFVVTADSVVVVDALGSPALAQALLQRIRSVTDKPVSHVLLTHYHADHIYGLQVFQAAGAKIVAQRKAREYLQSGTAQLRLQASRETLWPWIDDQTRLVEADLWLDGDADLDIGGVRFALRAVGPAHTPEDMVVHVSAQRLLFAGDLVFRGRIPFVGQADSRRWIGALDELLKVDVQTIVPGHGPSSDQAAADLRFTRDYLLYLRKSMGEAARNMEPFDEAYRRTDWSRFDRMPLFGPANRMNAYNTYLLMEHERD